MGIHSHVGLNQYKGEPFQLISTFRFLGCPDTFASYQFFFDMQSRSHGLKSKLALSIQIEKINNKKKINSHPLIGSIMNQTV